jgi:hypothetical protein
MVHPVLTLCSGGPLGREVTACHSEVDLPSTLRFELSSWMLLSLGFLCTMPRDKLALETTWKTTIICNVIC